MRVYFHILSESSFGLLLDTINLLKPTGYAMHQQV